MERTGIRTKSRKVRLIATWWTDGYYNFLVRQLDRLKTAEKLLTNTKAE